METDYYNQVISNFSKINKLHSITTLINEKIAAKTITKLELSEKLGISRVTLDTRLKKENWKKAELFLLQKIA